MSVFRKVTNFKSMKNKTNDRIPCIEFKGLNSTNLVI